MVMDAPWARVRDPEKIPQPLTPACLAELTPASFAELVRGNLLPRTDDRGGRGIWATLWATLSRDEALADRAYAVLAGFLEVTAAALAGGNLDAGQRKRATSFHRQAREAWARMAREAERRQPLAWAGDRAARFDAAGRSAIALLVSAVAAHRGATVREDSIESRDQRLWAALRQVGLDPSDRDGHPGSIDETRDALAWAGDLVEKSSPAARATAGILVAAVAAHRDAGKGEAAWADRRLWHILTVVGLDPRDHPSRRTCP